VERFYGGPIQWRIGARLHLPSSTEESKTSSIYPFRNSKRRRLQISADFDVDAKQWQVRSFTLCLAPSTVGQVEVYAQLMAHRGSVFFDDFGVQVHDIFLDIRKE
jgi:hypothetical protein